MRSERDIWLLDAAVELFKATAAACDSFRIDTRRDGEAVRRRIVLEKKGLTLYIKRMGPEVIRKIVSRA